MKEMLNKYRLNPLRVMIADTLLIIASVFLILSKQEIHRLKSQLEQANYKIGVLEGKEIHTFSRKGIVESIEIVDGTTNECNELFDMVFIPTNTP